MFTDCLAGVRQENLRRMRHASYFRLWHMASGQHVHKKKTYGRHLLTLQGNMKGMLWTFNQKMRKGTHVKICRNGGYHTRLGKFKESKVFSCVGCVCEFCEPCHNGFIQITLPMRRGIMTRKSTHCRHHMDISHLGHCYVDSLNIVAQMSHILTISVSQSLTCLHSQCRSQRCFCC